MNYKSCKYGDNCAFAHGEEELKKKVHVPSMYKTKLCAQYIETGFCCYGTRCQFIHPENLVSHESQSKPISYSQMLKDNGSCLHERVMCSLNPFLNEFNLIYKDQTHRLACFDLITQLGDRDRLVEDYLRIDAQIEANN